MLAGLALGADFKGLTAETYWCNDAMCVSGDFAFGTLFGSKTTVKSTSAETFTVSFPGGVGLVGWDSLKVNPTQPVCAEFCGVDMYYEMSICQKECSRTASQRWNNSSPFHDEWAITSITFWNAEVFDVYTYEIGWAETKERSEYSAELVDWAKRIMAADVEPTETNLLFVKFAREILSEKK
jgi:hypothetical protein